MADAGDIGGLLLETVFRFYFVKTVLVSDLLKKTVFRFYFAKTILVSDLLKKTLTTKVILVFILPVSLILKNKS